MFEAPEVALTMTREMRDPAKKIHAKSAPLADQLRRAVESVSLNLAEARGLLDRVLAMCWRLTHPKSRATR